MKFSKLLLLISILFLGGCAATGTSFQRNPDIPKDKGIIYLYRDLRDTIRIYDVFDGNDEEMCLLLRGGYCQIYAKPGEVQLWGKTREKGLITVDVKPGEEYFIKGSASYDTPVFFRVDNKIGLEEISKCVFIKKSETNWTIGDEGAPPVHVPISLPSSEIPKDKATICFYMIKMSSVWFNLGIDISEKKEYIDNLSTGSISCQITNPGTHVYKLSYQNINQDFIKSIKVNLLPGVISYIRYTPFPTEVTFIQEEEALKEIRSLKSTK